MRLRNVLKICLIFWESEPQYAYKRYAYIKKKHVVRALSLLLIVNEVTSPSGIIFFLVCILPGLCYFAKLKITDFRFTFV